MKFVCGLEDCMYDDPTDREIQYPSWPDCAGCRYVRALGDKEQPSDAALRKDGCYGN